MALLIRNNRSWMPGIWEDTDLSRFFERDSFGLAADVYENDDSVVVTASVPGLNPEDIAIHITGDTLSVSGERKDEKTDEKRSYYQRQLRYGSFAQSITLPSLVDADHAEAKFEHGILTITLPKAEEAKPKQIQIKA